MKDFCEENGLIFLEDTIDGLYEKGLVKSLAEHPEYRYFDRGVVIIFRDEPFPEYYMGEASPENTLVMNVTQWQSGDGAVGGLYTLEKRDGVWTITKMWRSWVS